MIASEEEYERQELNSAELVAEELELEESGQLSIGVAGEQRSLEGFAGAGKPAPTWSDDGRRLTAAELEEPAFELRVAGELVETLEEAGPRIVGTCPDCHGNGCEACEGVGIAELEASSAAEDWLEEPDEPPKQPKRRSSSKKQPKRVYRCGMCGRQLKPEHYVYSRHTGSRYCWPGEGCQKVR